jgi:hypothetical protein
MVRAWGAPHASWWCVQSDTNRSPIGNSLLTGKLTGNFAILDPQKPISLHETTVLQRLFTKFPTQFNRENILKNREFLSGNREFHLHTLVSLRSVLADKFSVEDETSPVRERYGDRADAPAVIGGKSRTIRCSVSTLSGRSAAGCMLYRGGAMG